MVYDSRYQESSSGAHCCGGACSDAESTTKEEQTPNSVELETSSPSTPEKDAASDDPSTPSKAPMIPPEASFAFMHEFGCFLVDNAWVKGVVFVVFGGYLAGAIYGITGLVCKQCVVTAAVWPMTALWAMNRKRARTLSIWLPTTRIWSTYMQPQSCVSHSVPLCPTVPRTVSHSA